MHGSLCLPSTSTRMGCVKPSRSHPPTPQLKRSFKYDICISDRSKLPVERATKSLARNSWVLRVQYGCCGYTDEYDVLRCLILSGEVSFPDFTRHFFPFMNWNYRQLCKVHAESIDTGFKSMESRLKISILCIVSFVIFYFHKHRNTLFWEDILTLPEKIYLLCPRSISSLKSK